MKHLLPITILVIVLCGFALPALAQDGGAGDLIVLNDTTPGIDIVITPALDATGAIALEITNASVVVTDVIGNIVFETYDPNIHGLELQFAPNAGTHILTIERLPGVIEAYIRIQGLLEITSATPTQLVSSTGLALSQETDLPLNPSTPSAMIDLAVPTGEQGTISVRFPGAPVTAQLVNTETGAAVATLTGSRIDGLSITVNTGNYQLVLLNNNTAQPTIANVSLTTPTETDFTALVEQASGGNITVADTSANTDATTTFPALCQVTVTTSSINLRSGPGTGYSVLEYAFRDDTLPVGGVNPEHNWLVVGTDTGSAWMVGTLGILSGECSDLTVYDVPYREAPAPQFSIQQPQVPVYIIPIPSESASHEDDDHEENEGGDD